MTVLWLQGHRVAADGEVINLTEMWRAAGADDSKRPANWERKEGAEFIDYMRAVLNVPPGHIIVTKRGRNGSTVAHWQIGLAYAKYLSPEFHAAANQIIRGYIEGLTTAAAPKITAPQLNAFARAATVIIRTFGQRAAVQPIADLARQLGLRVDASQAEILRQGRLNLPDPKGSP